MFTRISNCVQEGGDKNEKYFIGRFLSREFKKFIIL